MGDYMGGCVGGYMGGCVRWLYGWLCEVAIWVAVWDGYSLVVCFLG